jgi:hypothetical protein
MLCIRIKLTKKTRKKTQTRIDKTVAIPTLRHSSETWTLKENKSRGKDTISREIKFLWNVAG